MIRIQSLLCNVYFSHIGKFFQFQSVIFRSEIVILPRLKAYSTLLAVHSILEWRTPDKNVSFQRL